MKKHTKFGLLLAAVAAGTFYVVHKLTGKKTKPSATHDTTTKVATPPSSPASASPPHGSTVSKPNPATPDPFAPLPGQESLEGNVHLDQPGTATTSDASQYINSSASPENGQSYTAQNTHFDQPGDE